MDPQRNIDQYLTDADAQGLTVRYVVLTHVHVGHAAKAEYASVPMGDDDEIAFGQVRLVEILVDHGTRDTAGAIDDSPGLDVDEDAVRRFSQEPTEHTASSKEA